LNKFDFQKYLKKNPSELIEKINSDSDGFFRIGVVIPILGESEFIADTLKSLAEAQKNFNEKVLVLLVFNFNNKTPKEYIEDNSKLGDFKSEVKKRISDLANKNYQGAGDLFQPDFVLMYMPVESSVNMLYEDLDLIKQAYKSNIIIVGTASLLTTIRLVNQLLAQQKQAESVQQIVTAGTNLYETFVQFCDDLMDVQKRMADVNSKLNTTINRFNRNSKNKPSLFSQVNALKDFGINTNKEIPSVLLLEESEELEELDKLEGVLAND
jgi:DNA anti-recombination protein RmuC